MGNLAIPTIFLFIVAIAQMGEVTKHHVVIRQGFQGNNKYFIVCKGFPKAGTSGISKRETAKEAALLNAQMIAKEIFNETVDPVRNGLVKKFDVFDEYAIVYYVIEKKNLRKRLRKSESKKR
ncbi:MAG: hypothetical protein N2316_00775 [Spirochaetes bacterium]|nr:hypothetical protein [Spirochaetota bacterium]